MTQQIVESIDCNTCKYQKKYEGQGEIFYYCDHNECPSGYGNVLDGGFGRKIETPVWCPLLKK